MKFLRHIIIKSLRNGNGSKTFKEFRDENITLILE
jgi:hypothetical protein